MSHIAYEQWRKKNCWNDIRVFYYSWNAFFKYSIVICKLLSDILHSSFICSSLNSIEPFQRYQIIDSRLIDILTKVSWLKSAFVAFKIANWMLFRKNDDSIWITSIYVLYMNTSIDSLMLRWYWCSLLNLNTSKNFIFFWFKMQSIENEIHTYITYIFHVHRKLSDIFNNFDLIFVYGSQLNLFNQLLYFLCFSWSS